MAERIPAIRVTDPQSRDTTPQSPPVAQTLFTSNASETTASRSASPSDGRPNSSSGGVVSSPAKLLRSLSGTVTNQLQGQQQQQQQQQQNAPTKSTSSPPPPLAQQQTYIENRTTSPDAQSSQIDPLSQYIIRRTTFPQNNPPSLLRPTTSGNSGGSNTSDDKQADDRAESNAAPPRHHHLTSRADTVLSVASKEKKKGVAFLSRIIDRTKKRDTDDDASSNFSDAQSDLRPEGMEAEVFSQPINNIGYEPRHAQPPAYIRVRSKYKKERDFDRVFLAQELQGSKKPDKQDDAKSIRSVRSRRSFSRARPTETPDTIWAMQFSRDGKYLAAAGHDKIVRIWAVISHPGERRTSMDDSGSDHSHARHTRLSAPVFRNHPVREFEGHTGSVLDLSWSKNNFLLSSSMDKTVRLWHVSRDECLCTFKHNDFVTSIAFHPSDDRFFLAGSLDAKLRLWSIPDKTVAYWNNLSDMITAVEFTPDGKYAIGGCLNGVCMFYETEGLKYQTQIHVRSARGKNAKGSKITKIQAINYPPNSSNRVTKLLITSNDSRIRLYNLRDKSLEIKFKGHINDNSQIRASFSDDARYIACGSEDSKAYIWTLNVEDGEKNHQRPMEYFTVSDTTTTCVAFAPTKTRQLLGRSGDPMYDICNPPPVTLLSREEEHAGSRHSSRAPTEDGGSPPASEARYKRPEESPSYLARASHKNGNIIVTADFEGRIKVFRQDCAWAKRTKDNWDTSSIFTKKSLRRTASIATKGSSRSLRSAQGSVKTQAPSERILSWRQGITSTPSVAGSSMKSGKNGGNTSPRKSSSQLSVRSNKTPGRPETARSAMAHHPLPNGTKGSSTSSPPKTAPGRTATKQFEAPKQTSQPPTPTSQSNPYLHNLQADDPNPLGLHGDHSALWWKLAKNSAILHHNNHSNDSQHGHNRGRAATSPGLMPNALSRTPSAASKVSTLSIERSDFSGSGSSGDEFVDALDEPHPHQHAHNDHHEPMGDYEQDAHDLQHRGSNSEIVCRNCSSNSFKVRKSRDGQTKLCCVHCGLPA
ncbi:hypothetical protein AAFC00_006254 [Neodothiora populina]|uniref:WD40 repeat-like protein n=1 Tax=Neodothiora populina TaxID=2781224 RepID=A0ABR3P4K7_9PEZI